MQVVECAVIAAAGLGSRLGHGLPKCMLELGGQTLLSRLIENLENQVSRIHVVVGYREEQVINLCANLHRSVVIIRNPDFRTTNTVQSMAMGAQGLNKKTLFLDGDLIIEPSSLRNFINRASMHPILAGITRSHSENPVNVSLLGPPTPQESTRICAFTREAGHQYEWANIVAGPARMLDGALGYVYEKLQEHTPLAAEPLNLREVDTKADLEKARDFVSSIKNS